MRQLSEHLQEHDPIRLSRWLQQHPSLRQVDDHLSPSTCCSAYSNNEAQWVRLVGLTTHSTAQSTFFCMSSLPQPRPLPPKEQPVHGRSRLWKQTPSRWWQRYDVPEIYRPSSSGSWDLLQKYLHGFVHLYLKRASSNISRIRPFRSWPMVSK